MNFARLRPQAPLHQAARDAGQQHRPTGLGLDSAAVRLALVQRLRAEFHCHDAVFQAMRIVPRHQFVDSGLATQAYEDTSLPIGLGQTISKPSVVARMLSILHEGSRARASGTLGRVLEIGTGCGYQTALLGQMAQRVLSIERLKPLHDKARANLGEHRAGHIRLVYGDGRLGHPIGATGARLVTTLLHALRRRGLKRGVASQCIGGGEATAICIELLD